jgi:hypothetical protein
MKNNMLFAVIIHIQKVSASAFLPAKCMVFIEHEELSGADTACTNNSGIPQAFRLKI